MFPTRTQRLLLAMFALISPIAGPGQSAEAPVIKRTPREEEVLALLAKGDITKEIADQLTISFDTSICNRRRRMPAAMGGTMPASLTIL